MSREFLPRMRRREWIPEHIVVVFARRTGCLKPIVTYSATRKTIYKKIRNCKHVAISKPASSPEKCFMRLRAACSIRLVSWRRLPDSASLIIRNAGAVLADVCNSAKDINRTTTTLVLRLHTAASRFWAFRTRSYASNETRYVSLGSSSWPNEGSSCR